MKSLASLLNPAMAYDPLTTVDGTPQTVDLTVEDKKRARKIPVLVYLPKTSGAAPVALFSHGLGGNRQGSKFLGEHWAKRGYVAVFVQHPGSDDSVWKGVPPARVMASMRQAANAKNFMFRVEDIPAVLDALAVWNKTSGHVLSGKLDLSKIGMSGHSFGAVTTQAVSGQWYPAGASFTDERIKAAVIMSPGAPPVGDPKRVFGSVRIPWMLMTGTNDTAPIGNADMESRLAVYPALPPGGKYELVLDGAEHSVFTDRRLPGDQKPRNPNHHKVILALSTTFWDSYLRSDVTAKAWLEGAGPRSVMEKADHWQKK